MKKPTNMGKNQTGTDMAPVESAKTAQGAIDGGPSPAGDFTQAHAHFYAQYQAELEPIGTMPPPSKVRGVMKSALEALKGHKATVLLDKIGERLAFERTGTRLYELLLVKHEVHGSWPGGPTRADLLDIRNDEENHFHMLAEVLEGLGADSTTVTPCADVALVESLGLHNVIADPRTTLSQSLHAILVAELTDNDGWQMLIELAEGYGQTDLASQFRVAEMAEASHLSRVRMWLRAEVQTDAGVAESGVATA